jgi:hypothetical protein
MEEDDTYTNDWDMHRRCCGCNEDYVCEMEEQHEENEDDSLIMSYSAKPTAIFLNDDGNKSYYATVVEPTPVGGDRMRLHRTQLYMGFELELETGRFPREDCARFVLDTINTQSNDIVYLKEDGSLNHGFEIVSHPMTLGFATNHFDWNGISGLIKKGCKSWDTSTCGLHVHLSRSAFRDEKHLFKFFKLILDNSADVKRFAGRDSERWANFDKSYFLNSWNDEVSTTDALYGIGSNGRVYSVPVSLLPSGRGDGVPVTSLVEVEAGTRIEHLFAATGATPVLLATRAGMGLQCQAGDLAGRTRQGKAFLALDDGDEPLRAALCRAGDDRVLCLSGQGRALVFDLEQVRVLRSGGRGSQLMTLEPDERLACAVAFGPAGALISGAGRGGKQVDRAFSARELEAWRGQRARKGRLLEPRLREPAARPQRAP